MPKFIPLSPKAHASKAWRKKLPVSYSSAQSAVAVFLTELPQVIQSMPLVFLPSKDRNGNPGFELAALLSLTPGLNLYVFEGGRWAGDYVPAIFRSYPFRMLPDPSGQQYVLCFDEESEMLVDASESESTAFFDENDEPSPDLAKVLEFLKWQERGRAVTQRAVDLLAEQKLIKPWALNEPYPEGKGQPVTGLFSIDEVALKALDGSSLKKLQESNALVIAYAQLFSQQRLLDFKKLYEMQEKLRQQGESKLDGGHAELDLDNFFRKQDDTLKFTF